MKGAYGAGGGGRAEYIAVGSSTPGSGVDSALRTIRRWQEMERKLKGDRQWLS